MDLSSILDAFSRHKVISALVVVGTLAAMVGAWWISTPDYQARGSLILVPPPTPPTPADVASSPELQGRKTDNEFLRFGDPSVVAAVVAVRSGSGAVRKELAVKGVDDRFEVVVTNAVGVPGPLAGITTYGATEEEALRDYQIVSDTFDRSLYELQAAEGIDDRYMFTTIPVEVPDEARLQVSSTFRIIAALGLLGGIALITSISLADLFGQRAQSKRRKQGRLRRRSSAWPGRPRRSDPASNASRDEQPTAPANSEFADT